MKVRVLWGGVFTLSVLGGMGAYVYNKIHAPTRVVPPVRVGVVDGARLREAEPYLALTQFYEESLVELRRRFTQKRQELENLERKKRDPKIPTKKRAEYRKEFESELSQFDSEVRKEQDHLRGRVDGLRATIEEAHMGVIRELAKRYHLNLILNTNTYLLGYVMVFHADETLDLTDEVIQLLNKKLKNMSFKQEVE